MAAESESSPPSTTHVTERPLACQSATDLARPRESSMAGRDHRIAPDPAHSELKDRTLAGTDNERVGVADMQERQPPLRSRRLVLLQDRLRASGPRHRVDHARYLQPRHPSHAGRGGGADRGAGVRGPSPVLPSGTCFTWSWRSPTIGFTSPPTIRWKTPAHQMAPRGRHLVASPRGLAVGQHPLEGGDHLGARKPT